MWKDSKKIGKGIVLWGAGAIGKRVCTNIDVNNVIAVIDSDPGKVGTTYLGRPVISFADYLASYAEYFVLILPHSKDEILRKLDDAGIKHYFSLSDCPSEFSMPNGCDVLRKKVISEMEECANPAIYGCGFYATVLANWFLNETGHNVSVYLPKETSDEYEQELKREFPEVVFCGFDSLMNNSQYGDGTLFVADEWDIESIRADVGQKIKIINAFDITDREESYFNPRLLDFKNINRGKSCFIVGLGPSLSAADLTTIYKNKIKSISLNAISLIYGETPWRPNYYVASDLRIFDNPGMETVEDLSLEYNFFSDGLEDFWSHNTSSKNIKFHNEHNMGHGITIKFSDDISHVARFGSTVAYACIQIAAYMGFSNIYMLGFDNFRTSDNKIDYSHFYKENQPGEVPYVDIMTKSYRSARKYADEHGIHIYNATRGGRLEVFDRVDFDSLFTDGKFTPEKAVIHPRKAWYEDMKADSK